MTQVATTQNKPSTIKSFFENPNVSKRFEDIIGDKTRSIQFVSSVLQIANGNNYLKNADPLTIYNAALMAATLNLPINQNLGFAYIVPYGKSAQFILGYKGFIQLAQRSGQYKSINATEVYANQFISFNALTEELKCDFSIDGEGEIVGFAAYFELLNGFQKTAYWSVEKMKAHGKKYSKSFSNGPWKTDFSAMGKKTLLKLTIGTYGPMNVEIQKAIESDQAVIRNEEGTELEYVDHEDITVNPEAERLIVLINDSIDLETLTSYEQAVNELKDEEVRSAYQDRYMHLTPTE